MSIKDKKVLIHGNDMTSKIESIYETGYGYRASFTNGKINTFNKSDVEIVSKTPFGISEHEFSDSIAEIKAKANAGSTITLDVFEKWITLNKPDAIAIAKALGVTGEDLL